MINMKTKKFHKKTQVKRPHAHTTWLFPEDLCVSPGG